MTMQVLLTQNQINAARKTMKGRGISAIDSPVRRALRRLHLLGGISLGDVQKSWDVLAALDFIERHLAKNEAIADFGCFASEVLVSLHKLGYKNLTGIDLNPLLSAMPHQGEIRYQVSNFMQTPFADGSFAAITSISVIEHGFDAKALLSEMSRLLRPGGYFVASFDYWPDKIDTSGTTFFGMEWIIFSRQDIEEFVSLAANYGMHPTGTMEFSGRDRVINCSGKDYTFATLVLQKTQ